MFAAANLATAELKQNEIAQSLEEGSRAVTDVLDQAAPTTTPRPAAPSTPPRRRHRRPCSPAPTLPAGAVTVGAGADDRGPDHRRRRRPPAPTTTIAARAVPILAIGDSVMLGAAEELAAEGVTVDAEVSRQMVDEIPNVQALRDQGRLLGDAVIVHLGTNGPISEETVDSFFEELRDVRKVVVLTVSRARKAVDRTEQPTAGSSPEPLPQRQGRRLGRPRGRCDGDCFYGDGIHLSPTVRTTTPR